MKRRRSTTVAHTLAVLAAACDPPSSPVFAPRGSYFPPPRDTGQTVVGSAAPSLVVESFTVVEFRPTCVGGCDYLIYAPLLELRETSGRPAWLTSITFKLGSKTTGDCKGSSPFMPGASAYVDGFYDYLWSNDLIMVSLDGRPVADSVATVHATIRSADGTEAVLEATGTVQRMVPNPVLPPPRTNGWECVGGAA